MNNNYITIISLLLVQSELALLESTHADNRTNKLCNTASSGPFLNSSI